MEKTHQQSCNKPELSFNKPQNNKIFCEQNKLFPLLQPRLPSSVDPQDLTYLEEQRYYIIPDGVRPVMKTFRIEVSHTRCYWHVADAFKCFIYGTPDGWICEVTESWRMLSVHFCVQVLFWGLRELKRVELFEVSRPFVKMECAGRQLESEEIENFKTHPNFKELVRYIDVVSVWLKEMLICCRIMANFLLPVFGPIRNYRSRLTSTLLWRYSWWSIGHSGDSLWSGLMWFRASWITPHLSSGGSQTRRRRSQNQRVRVRKEVVKVRFKEVPSTIMLEFSVYSPVSYVCTVELTNINLKSEALWLDVSHSCALRES